MVGEALWLPALFICGSMCVRFTGGGSLRCRGPSRLREQNPSQTVETTAPKTSIAGEPHTHWARYTPTQRAITLNLPLTNHRRHLHYQHLQFITPVAYCTDRIPFPVNESSSLIIHNLYLHDTTYSPTQTNNLYIPTKLYISTIACHYHRLLIQFISSWWWAKNVRNM